MPNGETVSQSNASTPVPQTSPRPAWQLALILAALSALGGLTAVLASGIVRHKAVDLRETTTNLADAFTVSLERQTIPPDNIQRGEPEYHPFSDGGGQYFFPYEVVVPARLDQGAVLDGVRRELAGQGVTFELEPDQGTVQRLNLAFAGQPFAAALLTHEAAAQPLDLRATATRIAHLASEILQQAGAQVMLESGPEPREDHAAAWTVSEFQARFTAPPDMNVLRGTLLKGLPQEETVVTLGEGAGGALRIEISFQGKTVVVVHGQSEGAAMPPPVTDAAPTETAGEASAPPAAPTAETAASPLPALDELPLDSTVLEQQQLGPAELESGPFAEDSPAALKMPKIALIIDDGGYGGERTDRLLELDARLTLAILPNTPFAQETAERGIAKGFQIMLHMPMETYGSPFPGEITTAMDAAEIERLTLDALSQVPGVVGVNNHTGSKYTRDAERMADFLRVIKPKNLFFIDSITISKSMAYEVARKMSIPSAQRDIFIDNSSAPDLIRRQLREVILRAKSRGTAIGIGHFRPNTVRVLEEELPRLEEYGVQLVHASELVR